MNPEAVEWLEGLDQDQHLDHFHPALAVPDCAFASFKSDHDGGSECVFCWAAGGGLTVIG